MLGTELDVAAADSAASLAWLVYLDDSAQRGAGVKEAPPIGLIEGAHITQQRRKGTGMSHRMTRGERGVAGSVGMMGGTRA